MPYATLSSMKLLRWTGNTFIVVGATLLFFVVYELVGTSLITNNHQSALASEWDDELLRPRTIPTAGASPSAAPRKRRYSGPPPIARLIIPKIGLDRLIVEGAGLDQLAFGPGHYRGTAKPGHVGSSAIACHRTGWGSPCINVDKIKTGDELIIETKEGCAAPPCRFVYHLTRSIIVEPKDGWVLGGDPKSKAATKLVITTCTPKYTSLHRLILWADLVSPASGIK
jgi:sortase A